MSPSTFANVSRYAVPKNLNQRAATLLLPASQTKYGRLPRMAGVGMQTLDGGDLLVFMPENARICNGQSDVQQRERREDRD